LDFIVGGKVIVEIKATDYLSNVHVGQMTSYLKATGNKIGLLLNFGKTKLEIKRVIN
jgi:GxxExxY protein